MSNRGIIKIEVSGSSYVGKTIITAILAKALAKVFEETDALASIKVANLDGDYPKVAEQIDRLLDEARTTSAPFLQNLEQVLFVELGSANWAHGEHLSLEQIAVAQNHNASGMHPNSYIGPALIDADEPVSDSSPE